MIPQPLASAARGASKDDDLLRIERQHSVDCDQPSRLGHGLRDEQSIERIAVMQWQLRNRSGMMCANRQFDESRRPRLRGDSQRIGIEVRPPNLRLDRDFPNACRAEQNDVLFALQPDSRVLGKPVAGGAPRGEYGYRAKGASAPLKGVEYLVRQRGIKVLRNSDLSVERAEFPLSPAIERNDPRDGRAGPGDHNVLTLRHVFEQAREMGLRIVDIDSAHTWLSLVK